MTKKTILTKSDFSLLHYAIEICYSDYDQSNEADGKLYKSECKTKAALKKLETKLYKIKTQQEQKEIILTRQQLSLLLWAARSARSMHKEFLMHDDWSFDMGKERRLAVLSAKSGFERAIKLAERKLKP